MNNEKNDKETLEMPKKKENLNDTGTQELVEKKENDQSKKCRFKMCLKHLPIAALG